MADKKLTSEDILGAIEQMSLLELSALVKAIEEKFGVSAQAMMMPAGQAPAAAGAEAAGGAPAAEEQTIFNVILSSAGTNKIGVIKAIRELVPTLGLKEAKDLVEAAPKEVMSQVNKATAEEAKKKLTEAGAQVELK
ncbi:50S ribosomal protein L7/L12 [Candidatus Microgenomates bacterium]|nr:50S ribosomal protein L7/L12 [Candidatus Microgenomates bacterium]